MTLISFYLKIFIYLTDVEPDDGCMSYIPGSHKIGYAIRSAIYKKHIKYQPYWSIRDFKQIVIDNKEYFTNYFNNSEIINNFLKEADLLENTANKENMDIALRQEVLLFLTKVEFTRDQDRVAKIEWF